MKKKVFTSVLLSSVITMVLTAAMVLSVVYVNSEKALRQEVASEAVFVSEAINSIESGYMDYVSEIGKGTKNRITVISPEGNVIYDNYAASSGMDNHLSRPEVKDSLETGIGESTRHSDTLGEKIYYYAVKLDSGDVLRIASATKSALGIIGNAAGMSFFLMAYILIIGFVIANILTAFIVKPIYSLDLDSPLENKAYEELSPLLVSLDKKNRKINRQMEKLSEQQKEFDYITSSMSEGLVVFGAKGDILSANASAKKILGGDAEGSYLRLCRDAQYINAVNAALAGKAMEAKIEKNGRIYRLAADPVDSGLEGSDYSAVLFIIDITEREQSETLRREFSANVSHELKTPLTSIMGYAEIIENGIAKPEDVPHFAKRIHSEAARLMALIEDIIRLSQLDEGNLKEEFAPVELSEICKAVLFELSDKAKGKGIELSFDGGEAVINGFKPVLHEMIFNLCDNAVTYNKAEGSVRISLKREGNEAVLSVSDTGIGIAAEHKDRIFERFYRVDKSRSKETGGTGLGLSIVKHGALMHNGKISVESVPKEGTVITVRFRL